MRAKLTGVAMLSLSAASLGACAHSPQKSSEANWPQASDKEMDDGLCSIHHVPMARMTLWKSRVAHDPSLDYAESSRAFFPNAIEDHYIRSAPSAEATTKITAWKCPQCEQARAAWTEMRRMYPAERSQTSVIMPTTAESSPAHPVPAAVRAGNVWHVDEHLTPEDLFDYLGWFFRFQ